MTDVRSPLPFDDIRALAADLPAFDTGPQHGEPGAPVAVAFPRQDLAQRLCMGQLRSALRIRRPVVSIYAASYAPDDPGETGLDSDGVGQLVAAIQAETAPVCEVCRRNDLGLRVFELAPEMPVARIDRGAAMQEADCAATIAYGMEATAGGCDLLALSAIAAGQGASLEALAAVILDLDTEHKMAAAAVSFHSGKLTDPLEALRRLGGREAAAVAGGILAARMQSVPVILDGSMAVAVACLLERLQPGATDHCVVSGLDRFDRAQQLVSRLGCPVVLAGEFEAADATVGALAAGVVVSMAASVSQGDGGEPS